MNRVERLLFSRIEIWIVLACIPIFLVVLVVFGAMVKNVAQQGNTFGIAGRIAYRIASVPSDVKKLLTYEDPHSISASMSLRRDQSIAASAHERFPDRSGFRYSYPANSNAVYDYVLLSRYDGDAGANVVEFIDLNGQETLFSWPLNDATFRNETFENPFITFPSDENEKLLARHPYAETDGTLVFHASYSPLYAIDACGNIEWRNGDFAYHHSLERDGDGSYWAPGLRETTIETFDEKYKDDHIVKISDNGDVLYSKSVTEILIENGLINRMYVYDRYVVDPIHLNDVEPVLSDSPHWKKGDVFLSLGHLNMVLLFRPSTAEVIWWSQDVIMHQHDIDIVEPGQVSVYNNNRTTRASGDTLVGLNELVLYDVPSDRYKLHFEKALEKFEVQTINQGLHDFDQDGNVMLEETNFGRLLMVDVEGSLIWEYVNRASDGKIYTLNWARLVPGGDGDSLKANLTGVTCT